MMSYSYSLNCLQYVLMQDDVPILRPLDEVSLAFDKEYGTLHKHGAPEMVDAWFKKKQASLRESGLVEWADNLVVITGRFPLDDLNKCLSTSGYVLRMYTQVLAGTLAQLPMLPDPVVPPVLAPIRRAMFRA